MLIVQQQEEAQAQALGQTQLAGSGTVGYGGAEGSQGQGMAGLEDLEGLSQEEYDEYQRQQAIYEQEMVEYNRQVSE